MNLCESNNGKIDMPRALHAHERFVGLSAVLSECRDGCSCSAYSTNMLAARTRSSAGSFSATSRCCHDEETDPAAGPNVARLRNIAG